MTSESGGPAFPCHPGIENPLYDGMTLRDFFAIKALQGICASGSASEWSNDRLSAEAYEIADAMLKARQA
jgi:hypothetical protein